MLTNARLRPGADDHVAPFPSPPPAKVRDWMPSKAQRRSLGRRGRAWLDMRLKDYAYSPAESDVVLTAARSLDEAQLWRDRSRRWKNPSDAVRAGRLQLLHEREFLNALVLLKERP